MSTKKNKQNETPDSELFISRELSWLDFNSRVLDEAFCPANPLLERLKFIAIFSSNLDEFFMVRIAGLRQLVKMEQNLPDPAGNRPADQLAAARRKIERLVKRQYSCLHDEILPGLERHGVRLSRPADLSSTQRAELTGYFTTQVLPVLTPLAVDQAHPFPILNSGAIEIAVSMKPADRKKLVYAFVEVPDVLPRFIEVPGMQPGRMFVLLEDVIMDNLGALFSGCEIEEFFPFRVTRDMDFSVEDEGAEDLLQSIEKKLLQRRHREPIRVEVLTNTRGPLARWLEQEFRLDEQFWYAVRGPLHLKQFFELVGKARLPELLEPAWPAVEPAAFSEHNSVFDAISAKGTILVAPPFHSFSPVVRLLQQAADDPDVLAIKQTLYRVSGNSPVVRSLQRAAENGKQVTVVVELKARFDEGNNIAWARLLEESGAHVVYGVAGLKVHSKALLVVRREDGAIRRYVHLSTGNYNDKTAALYTDLGIMSSDPDLCFDVANLFNVLTGYSSPPAEWRKIAASPFDLRRQAMRLIEREIANSTPDRPGRIIAKMNSLSDEKMIRLLHKAADAGVEIDLIVRGICCYKPRAGQENVRIISIVDRYLEHSRLFYFFNNGDEEYYLSSADWMYRNLDKRVELLFPIEDEKIRGILMRLLEFQLNDTDKLRRLQASGSYTRSMAEHYTGARSQYNSYRYLKELAGAEMRDVTGEALKVFTSPERPVPTFAEDDDDEFEDGGE
ncbi:polyphosphate kinase 1 [uncultured Victivallis sp.]|uniref:polyphosphate kinase 1 n=1 Tax=uncultured Victivallis sp. TaxID=354118 RepID=UPI00258A1BBD|nr:polyphosphate kinase 1 [uncultured Victivallis sp.]